MAEKTMIRDVTLTSVVTLWLSMNSAMVFAGDPAWPGNHKLTQSQVGDVLVAELRCAACHLSDQRDFQLLKSAPDLAEVGSRVSPEYLQRFLASPSAVQPGTTMPDALASRPEEERGQIAEALTHFLVAQSKGTFRSAVPDDIDRDQGRLLFHAVGCVACHGPKEVVAETPPVKRLEIDFEDELARPAKNAFQPIAVNLGHIASKYSIQSLADFLFQPLRVRHSGRMPDMKLTPAEARAIAGYLIGESHRNDAVLQPEESLVKQGRKYFQELNCAACHALPGIQPAPKIASLQSADLTRGCLSPASVRSPRFSLEEAQIEALTRSLREKPVADTDEQMVAKTLTAFRCIACHVRDDYGGVHETYNSYFVGTELKMGDDGRIPPPLTLVGAKLQPAWLKKVLFDGESVRPYMSTRMPQYGTAALQHLPDILARFDVMQGREMRIPNPESRTSAEREREQELRAAGRELLGDKGLNCIACHNFNGKPAPVNQGIDLLTTYTRLQPGWFDAYLRNPNAFRPRTIMPTGWPNGVAAHKTILDGETDRQIEAIWYYLSLGTSAADPSGIRGVSTRLSVDGVARIHRGRSRVAGFRGIAVGLPEKLSYAFNAETGTLSAIWSGDFIGVNWNGQGSGDFTPASDPILLAQDVSFAHLENESTAWPLMPTITKDAKLNTDPLYPKNVGYQFGGYFLDKNSIPTFMYRAGTIEIEDRITAVAEAPAGLKRVVRLNSPAVQTVWFRALTGSIQNESDHVFRSGHLRLTVPNVDLTLRAIADEQQQSELLLYLNIPQGETTLELFYEPINE